MFSRNVLLSINQLSERPQHQLRIIGNLLYHIISALFTAGIDAATPIVISVACRCRLARHLAHMRPPRRIADSSSVCRHNSWKAGQAQAISKLTKALAAGAYYSFKSGDIIQKYNVMSSLITYNSNKSYSANIPLWHFFLVQTLIWHHKQPLGLLIGRTGLGGYPS